MNDLSHFPRRVGTGRKTHAFTVPELLAVVAIIAIIISMLMPSLARARYEASTAVCIANRHSLAMAMVNYTPENRGFFPRHDFSPSTGKNTWDGSNLFPDAIRHYGAEDYRIWDCAVTPQFGVFEHLQGRPKNFEDMKLVLRSSFNNFSILPFAYWVPRRSGGVLFPSNQVDPTAGPDGWAIRVGGATATGVNKELLPLLTDYAFMPTNVAANWKNVTGTHRWRNEPEALIIAFIDGHVERRPAPSIIRRFSGSCQNFY